LKWKNNSIVGADREKLMTLSKEQIEGFIKADIYRVLSKGFSYPGKTNMSDMRSIIEELATFPYLDESMYPYLDIILSNIEIGEIQKEYSRLFLKGTIPTCESSYNLRMDVIPDVSAFYTAFGLTPKSGESPDSLPSELEFASILSLKIAIARIEDDADITKDAYKKFLKEHMFEFVKRFSKRVDEANPIPFYKAVTELLRSLVEKEMECS